MFYYCQFTCASDLGRLHCTRIAAWQFVRRTLNYKRLHVHVKPASLTETEWVRGAEGAKTRNGLPAYPSELRSHRIVVVGVGVGWWRRWRSRWGRTVGGVACASIYLVCDFMSLHTSSPPSLYLSVLLVCFALLAAVCVLCLCFSFFLFPQLFSMQICKFAHVLHCVYCSYL